MTKREGLSKSVEKINTPEKEPQMSKDEFLALFEGGKVEDIEKNIEVLDTMENEEYITLAHKLKSYENRNSLSQTFVNIFLKKGFSDLSELKDKHDESVDKVIPSKFQYLNTMLESLSDTQKESGEKLSISEKSLVSTKKLFGDYPEIANSYISCISKKFDKYDTKLLIDFIKELSLEKSFDYKKIPNLVPAFSKHLYGQKITEYPEDFLYENFDYKKDEIDFNGKVKWFKFIYDVRNRLQKEELKEEPEESNKGNINFTYMDNILAVFSEGEENPLLEEYFFNMIEHEGREDFAYFDYAVLKDESIGGTFLIDRLGKVQKEVVGNRIVDVNVSKVLSKDFFYKADNYVHNNISPQKSGIYCASDMEITHILDINSGDIEEVDVSTFIKKPLSKLTPEERRRLNDKVVDFKVLSSNFFRASAHDFFDIDLEKYDIETQMWFMDFIKRGDNEKFDRVADFVDDYGSEGIKTFLALEAGDENGDKILEIGESENIDANSVKKVFGKFNEIINILGKGNEELKKSFLGSPDNDIDMRPGVMKRAEKVLLDCHKNLDKKEKLEKYLQKLDDLNNDAVIFVAGCDTYLKNNPEAKLEDVVGVDVETRDTASIFKDENNLPEQMKTIIEENYPDPLQRKKVLSSLDKKLDNRDSQGAEWFMVTKKFDNEKEATLTSFTCLEKNIDGSREWSTFNVNRQFVGVGIGEHVIEKFINTKARNGEVINASRAQADKAVVGHYINKNNFFANHIYRDEDTGVVYFNMRRDDSINFETKATDEKNKVLLSKFYKEGVGVSDLLNKEKIFAQKYEKNSDQMIAEVEKIFENGYIVSKIISPENEKNTVYYIFEKNEN